MAGLCQDCDGCCRVLEVHAIGKKFHQPCKYLTKTENGPGCSIYSSRPEVCWTYECVWLNSQIRPLTEKMPYKLRPDVCKVVLGNPIQGNPKTLFVYPYPGHQNAWRRPPVSDYLREVLSRGATLVIVLAAHRIVAHGDMVMVGTEAEFAKLLE